jgi:GxxExxY protein
MGSLQCLNDQQKEHVNMVTDRIIGLAIEVHRALGPGLLEPTYTAALRIEFDGARMSYENQLRVAAVYKGHLIGEYRIDFIVEELVVVEVKSVERMPPVFDGQLLTYLRVTDKPVGLLINFNSRRVAEGVKRLVL